MTTAKLRFTLQFMRGILALGLALAGSGAVLFAQTAPPASDNPLAGLNLNGAGPANSGGDDGSPSFLGKFAHHLVLLAGDHFTAVDPVALDGVKFIAFYYSAGWCGPCREFSPKLVEFYKAFKPTHPSFELIFVSQDNDADGMLDYMKSDQMPWAAVRFDDIQSRSLGALQFRGSGIPDLVLVDEKGKVLADSFINGEYEGPQQVMRKIQQLVPAMAPSPADSRALAVRRVPRLEAGPGRNQFQRA